MPDLAKANERLLERASKGDQRAFAAIFERYHQRLYRYCAAIVGDPEDARDALQNTMVKVLGSLPGERRKLELEPWLYRVAHNESIEIVRRRREVASTDPEELPGAPGPEASLETRERLRRLLDDLRELPERQRGALVMRELGGLSFEQIGTAFETSARVARQTIYEARVGLQEMAGGRAMDCDEVRRKLSDGDRRVIRRRDVRAHLRHCAGCREFGAAISSRRGDLAAIAPLPALAAAGLLQGVLGAAAGSGGGHAAGAAGAGALGKAVGGSVLAKAVATTAIVAAVGVGAADRTGLVHVFGDAGPPAREAPRAAPEGADPDGGASGNASGGAVRPGAAGATGRGGSASVQARQARRDRRAAAQRQASSRDGAPATSHGRSALAHAHSGGRGTGVANAHGANPQATAPHGGGSSNAGGQGKAQAPGQTGAAQSGAQTPAHPAPPKPESPGGANASAGDPSEPAPGKHEE